MNINESIEIEVRAKEFWNDTFVDIKTDETYLFEANGKWTDLFKHSNPDGYNNIFMNPFTRKKRSPTDKWIALMGSIDRSDSFLIGKNNTVEFNRSGRLFCFANDIKGFYWNNCGKINLKITRIK